MKPIFLTRRNFVRVGALATLGGLYGCQRFSSRPVLRATQGTLPKELIRAIPNSWIFDELEPKGSDYPFKDALQKQTDLLAIGDGWLSQFSRDILSPIDLDLDGLQLDSQARNFLQSLYPDFHNLVFPLAVSPWVMLFRNGQTWLSDAEKGWEVLLSPSLANRIVLPESPRLIMSLAEQIKSPNSLRKLRSQVKSFDDINALNWIASGEASVAVLPLQSCLKSLTKDPRLSVVLPSGGAPLNWTLLISLSGNSELLSESWLNEIWQLPLLARLLSIGFIPPLTRSKIKKAEIYIPSPFRSLVLPADEIWDSCWSLLPLNVSEQDELQRIWIESTP